MPCWQLIRRKVLLMLQLELPELAARILEGLGIILIKMALWGYKAWSAPEPKQGQKSFCGFRKVGSEWYKRQH